MLRPDKLRTEPLAHLPALLALALAAIAMPSHAETTLLNLCSGNSLPAQPTPGRDCDQACHIGCSREKKASGRF